MAKKTTKNVTIKDVAAAAGVAVSTVSRVLNNLDRVSDETREKVQRVADEMGFVRNTLAASVKTGRSNMIMVIVPDIINEFYTAVIQGVEESAVQKGYFTMVFASNEMQKKEEEFFCGKFGKIVDGVVMIPAHEDLSFVKEYVKPIVIVDRYVSGSCAEAVIIDNLGGARMLTQELVDNGHKDIAILIGPEMFNIGKERMGGYTQVMCENGLQIHPEYVKRCTWYAESGYEKTKELLALPNPPSAIFATNNLLGIGCMQAIVESGLKLGEDISLVCFDDTLMAQYMTPGITVVKRETVEMGRLAAEKLIQLIEGEKCSVKERKIVLPVTLVRRNSVKKLN